ncbi:MAG: polysaccharide biosynthesis protein [Gammaproteobacteria bacterium]
MYELRDKSILVTGACGTVGSALIRELLAEGRHQIGELVGMDNNETGVFSLDQEYLSDPRARFLIGDVRDRDLMVRQTRGVHVIFHAAALKHVIICERSPMDAIQTNINGVENVIRAAQQNGVERVVSMSSDKAVNPTSVMGTSKLMGERLITAANSNRREERPVFISTRFGNVLGSSGSVVPVFASQIARGGPVTLTDPKMTRFVMSIEESVRLVIESALLGQGGEVFITKMPVIRISDLASAMIKELAPRFGEDPADIRITEIGTKPGEKLYEELMSQEETRRALELERYFAVLPAFRGIYQAIKYEYPSVVSEQVTNPYVSNSETPLAGEDLTRFLHDNGLLDVQVKGEAPRRYWPGDKESSQA